MPSNYWYAKKWTERYRAATANYECPVCGHKWSAFKTDEAAKNCPACATLRTEGGSATMPAQSETTCADTLLSADRDDSEEAIDNVKP